MQIYDLFAPPVVLLAPLLLSKQTEGLRKIEAAGAEHIS